jgi:phosphoribosyl 1,2-cyclic phosphodiesterase
MLYFRSLASGSSGNAFLLRTDTISLLFDAGLRRSTLESMLADEGVPPASLGGILISHEHRDHLGSAEEMAERYQVPVWANDEVLRAAGMQGLPSAAVMDVGRPMLLGDVEVTSFPVSHDAVRPVGFVIRAGGRVITLATDLGRADGHLTEAVAEADLVVLESNHDPEMLHSGRYPPHLRKRVAGPTGHLANYQAAEIIARHVKSDGVDVWLAHLSRNNNTQALALRTVGGITRASGLARLRVGIARRDRPSLVWTGEAPPRQLSLFDVECA